VSLPPQSSPKGVPPRVRTTLRHNYLSFIEDTALTLGVMAPTGTCGIVLPLLIAKGGNATWLIFLLTLVAFSLIMYSVHRFSAQCASAGSLADFAAAAHLSVLDFAGDVDWAVSAAAREWYARMKSRPSFRALLADRVPGMIPPAHYADLDF